MSTKLTAALQNLLNCQFQAGRALGLYEAAIDAETPNDTYNDLHPDSADKVQHEEGHQPE